MTRLCCRSTFIDVVSSVTKLEGAVKRSKSWSITTPKSVCDPFLEVEEAYVESLESRAEGLAALAMMKTDDKSDTVSTAHSETPFAPDSPRVHEFLLHTTESHDDAGSPTNHYLKSVSPASTPTTQSRVATEYGTEQELESQFSAVACNKGSRGHPELCGRPCVQFAVGRCSGNCGFCHYTHPKRRGHLDRRNRMLFQAISFHDRLTLFRPMIQSRLAALASKSPEAEVAAREVCRIFDEWYILNQPSDPSESLDEAGMAKLRCLHNAVSATSSLRSLLALLLDAKEVAATVKRGPRIDRAVELLRNAIEGLH